jgi:hypothetical protein
MHPSLSPHPHPQNREFVVPLMKVNYQVRLASFAPGCSQLTQRRAVAWKLVAGTPVITTHTSRSCHLRLFARVHGIFIQQIQRPCQAYHSSLCADLLSQ